MLCDGSRAMLRKDELLGIIESHYLELVACINSKCREHGEELSDDRHPSQHSKTGCFANPQSKFLDASSTSQPCQPESSADPPPPPSDLETPQTSWILPDSISNGFVPGDCQGPYETSVLEDDQQSKQAKPERTMAVRSLLAEHNRLDSRFQAEVSVAFEAYFDFAVGVLILTNSVVMLLDLEAQGAETAVLLGLRSHGWTGAESFFSVFEHIFAVMFLLELIARVAIEKRRYFRQAMNGLDAMLVLISCIDLYILTPIIKGSVNNVVLLRLLRLAKLVRAVRIIRTLRLFRGLRVLVKACTSFLPSLCWAMVLLWILMMLFGLMIGNLLQDFIADETQDYDMRLWVWRHYGTARRSIYTMYEITFAGNWPTYARPLLEHVNPWYTVFFIMYITLVVFAVIRVITAIFLKDTLDAANGDAQMMVQDRMHKTAAYVKNLEDIFHAADVSGDGLISEQELLDLLGDKGVVTYLEALDLEVHQGTALFHLLDDGDGQITYDEFIDGILRFKGPARSIDLIAMQLDCQKMHKDLRSLITCLEDRSLIAGLEETKVLHKRERSKEARRRTQDLRLLAEGDLRILSESIQGSHELSSMVSPTSSRSTTGDRRHRSL
eukprot:TRINITY_DN36114_c0_g1_i1.p1 TRINITY_DN36114_c0_g1~~TRINITY_DN36114_c0_g1_i1.p1  ORF type:complete len:610 (+),score=102.00 TRINITY_DN36114_c0_g1_i1:25-1854(+)